MLVQISALALRPEREPYRSLSQHWRRQESRRYLLFAVTFIPILLAIPLVAGLRLGFYDGPFAVALLIVSLIGVQTLVLWSDNVALARIETRLEEREMESSRILQSIGDAVIVTDADAHILRMNPVAETLTGWQVREAVGRPLADVFRIVDEDRHEPMENPVETVKRLGTVVGLANHTLLYDRSGQATRIADSSAPIRAADNSLLGIVLTFRDVTASKTAEDALRRSEDRLRVALEAAQLGTWERDLATGSMECSSIFKAIFGRAADEPFNYQDLLQAIHPGDLPAVQEAADAAIRGHSSYRSEYRVLWPDHSLHWVIVSGRPVRDGAGVVTRLVGVVLDVTDRHRATQALLQSEKLAAVGRLAASIAHEINNPLESVTNLLYLARTGEGLPEDSIAYLDLAERELRRVSAIANQTLRFHKQASSPKPVPAPELVDSVLQVFQGKLVNSRVRVHRRDRKQGPVICFEGEIRQVLSNLIGNALDAMQPGGGKLYIRTREGTRWDTGQRGVFLTIADSGPGMSAQTLSRLFEPFFTTKGFAGTGLGLWVSYEIVARHDGALKVCSVQRAGRNGTTFRLFLPSDAVERPEVTDARLESRVN